ncbi:MAG: transglutaminase-like domain-containing protein [Candidatus Omnitrophica bacterium]|nr:transglutaminase-like domain-containing protein [Candidatus Omnitrophota bacterium]
MKKFYTAFVSIFWFTMMGLLFHREVLPTLIITNPTGYEIELTNDYPVRESWMGIYFKDRKIGFSNTVIVQDVDNGVAGYRINETLLLRLNMLGEKNFVRMKGASFFSESYLLKNFYYRLVSGEYKLEVSGDVKADELNLVIKTDADIKVKSLKIKQNTLISNSVSPILLFKKLDINKEISFEIFNPISFGTNRVSIRNIGIENLEFNKKEYQAYVFEIDSSGIKTKTWMTKDGDILKEESGLGFTMHKEDPKHALDIDPLSFGSQDLAVEFALPSNMEIAQPRDVFYLKIDKGGEIVEIFKDKEPLKEDILALPIEEIREEDFVQSSDERIAGLAREIINTEKDSWTASKKILHWVYDNVRKVPALSIPSSLDVLRTMQGDCNEHTVLFTALARSVGIPTKMVAGVVYLDNAFYYHAWPKVYVGEWINMDPTLGQEIADALHIPLLEGGLKEQLELIRIIGELEIRIVDYK